MPPEEFERGFFRDLARLIKAWVSGTYHVFPWVSFFMLVYIASPLDFIPEWLPIIGVIDDAAMVGLLIRSLKKDIEKFIAWEKAQMSPPAPTAKAPTTSSEVVDAEFEDVKEGVRQSQRELRN